MNRSECVCVVDDDISVREAIVAAVRAEGWDASGFSSAKDFLSHPARQNAACLVLDVDLPDISGLALQSQLQAADDRLPIIFVTGFGDIPMSVRAIKAGAVDFLTKPFDAGELIDAIRRAFGIKAMLAQGEGQNAEGSSAFDGIIGASAPLQHVLGHIKRVAPTDTTVLIQGETGTGKERLARAVHALSARRNGPFIRVNCASIPGPLLESELMGHEKGAFTGALARRVGRFELADGGTIFLDEIGEMALELQPKLLRLLQEKEFERVGGSRTIRADVRVVAATNRDLRKMAEERTFREDLYYRLSAFPITVPPLRHRREDIEALMHHFAATCAARVGKRIEAIAPESVHRMGRYDWPGNIRELQNVVERAVILAQGPTLDVPAPGEPASSIVEDSPPLSQGLADVSRAHILRVLDETNWVIAGPNGAAARLAMNRSTLNFRMKKLGIVRPPRGER
ncbi:Response regulator of zinc sigma-54-dependent two-component system [Labilithrix luteola]|uniref:Response regulator of zinc sigma-54-dependent two-component system n=1 Tax=Labilithrix luteola TaxID=1391654 RepID=A0A0K1PYW4_9BACT|nr:sigma-54 dependent transcriptional regulator [Labilithrix luteola]AKU98705.1 Response regulator of zinc sigma-54-dependent two-component system [Labilithrix luteola]